MTVPTTIDAGASIGNCVTGEDADGYRTRPWDTRVGTIELKVPELRLGTGSPEFLLCPRWRAEQALVAVICQAYVEGVSTRARS